MGWYALQIWSLLPDSMLRGRLPDGYSQIIRGFLISKIKKWAYNMDIYCVEMRQVDGMAIVIDTFAMEWDFVET